ncbi:MAG TPA: murein L,D-transpeptidase catalytic domain family protein [Flavipsychrobacter sp.]|nr:murein L,D-transpeptidase catalytic domain family protein [Flavipsychrobacter sp.]
MKKLLLCAAVYLVTAFSFKSVSANEVNSSAVVSQMAIENYISGIYNQIDFCHCSRLPFAVFEKAYRGYLNLRNAGKLNTDKDILTICDFTLSSTQNRIWVIDLRQKKVIFNTYVAHGQGSGDEYATSFSNDENSHKSSLGFYVTSNTYIGEHGTSLHLNGMDMGFNDAAYDRGIVVHGADYVCSKFIDYNQRLGRSWGCPAVPSKISDALIETIKDGTCLFIYYPQKSYMKDAYWVNKKIDHLPMDMTTSDFMPLASARKKVEKIEYVSPNGSVDSVKTIQP